jgi:hypothetical protein
VAERNGHGRSVRARAESSTPKINVENRLREPILRVCCQHELATGRFAGDCGFGRRIVFAGTVSPAQVQFCTRHALRLFGARAIRDEKPEVLVKMK